MRRLYASFAKLSVWLWSCGPLGTDFMDSEQQPQEKAEFQQARAPREQRIYFGALDPSWLSFAERMMAKDPRASQGDFRDWDTIDAWAASIARDLEWESKEVGSTL